MPIVMAATTTIPFESGGDVHSHDKDETKARDVPSLDIPARDISSHILSMDSVVDFMRDASFPPRFGTTVETDPAAPSRWKSPPNQIPRR